jgi:hypothetical protein
VNEEVCLDIAGGRPVSVNADGIGIDVLNRGVRHENRY